VIGSVTGAAQEHHPFLALSVTRPADVRRLVGAG
jgi:hypothetical protein